MPKDKYSKELQALYDWKNDKKILLLKVDNWSGLVAWHRQDYIKETEKQLEDSDVHEGVHMTLNLLSAPYIEQ